MFGAGRSGDEDADGWLPDAWEPLVLALTNRLADAYRDVAPIPAPGAPLPEIPQIGRGYSELPALWDRIAAGSTRLGSPRMIGHMDHAPHPAAAFTDAMVSAFNNNLLFRELSPIGSEIEEALIAEFSGRLGLSADTPGLFASGGSLANLTALFAAVGGYAPSIPRNDVGLFIPHGAHSSIGKAAAILGLDPAQVKAVAVDDAGRMDVDALDTALASGSQELKVVVAILGGTVTGSVDPIARIADISERHGAWLHVDAVYGGALAYSTHHRGFLEGTSRAQSISLGPQKWLFAPRLCALCLFPRMRDFDPRLGVRMPYSARAGTHRGTWGVQGSRRADAIPLWVALQVLGRDMVGALVDAQIALARRFHDLLAAHPVAAPVHHPDLNIQAFRWGEPDRQGDRVLALQRGLEDAGAPWVSVSRWQGEYVLRTVLLNPRTDEGVLTALLSALDTMTAMSAAHIDFSTTSGDDRRR